MRSTVRPIKYKDHRTYDFHRTFGTAPLILEPFNFDTFKLTPDQRKDGLPEACTAYTHNDIASNEDRIIYDDYDFTYRNTLRMMGAEYGEPCDILKALKATTVYGVKSKQMTPADALLHRRGPYFIVKALSDKFEGLVSAMKVKQGCLSLATPWFPSFELPRADGTVPSPGDWSNLLGATWHDWEACGLELINGEPHIIAKSWQGSQYGKRGYIYFSRDQINHLLSIKGAGAFGQKHAEPGDIQVVEMTILETIISYLRMWVQRLLKPAPTSQIPTPVHTPLPDPVLSPTEPIDKYLWDTPEQARHSVRVICDEEGLTLKQKNELCATVQAESGFKTQAKNYNFVIKNGINHLASTDFGICQINDFYHIGPGKDFPSTDYVLTHPAECVRWMCGMWKAGKMNLWSAWVNGSYKHYL